MELSSKTEDEVGICSNLPAHSHTSVGCATGRRKPQSQVQRRMVDGLHSERMPLASALVPHCGRAQHRVQP